MNKHIASIITNKHVAFIVDAAVVIGLIALAFVNPIASAALGLIMLCTTLAVYVLLRPKKVKPGVNVNNLQVVFTPEEEKVLRLRFGLDGGRKRTVEEISLALNIPRERVRLAELRAMKKIQAAGQKLNYGPLKAIIPLKDIGAEDEVVR